MAPVILLFCCKVCRCTFWNFHENDWTMMFLDVFLDGWSTSLTVDRVMKAWNNKWCIRHIRASNENQCGTQLRYAHDRNSQSGLQLSREKLWDQFKSSNQAIGGTSHFRLDEIDWLLQSLMNAFRWWDETNKVSVFLTQSTKVPNENFASFFMYMKQLQNPYNQPQTTTTSWNSSPGPTCYFQAKPENLAAKASQVYKFTTRPKSSSHCKQQKLK